VKELKRLIFLNVTGDSYAIFGKVYKQAYVPKGRLQGLPCSQASLKQKILVSLIMVKGNIITGRQTGQQAKL
jgi:hypothetical protein